jgi:hypothetical protein
MEVTNKSNFEVSKFFKPTMEQLDYICYENIMTLSQTFSIENRA